MERTSDPLVILRKVVDDWKKLTKPKKEESTDEEQDKSRQQS